MSLFLAKLIGHFKQTTYHLQKNLLVMDCVEKIGRKRLLKIP